jgi:hypothetical protein
LNDQLPLDLQSRYEKPEHVGAPYAIGSDTSKEAAKSIVGKIAEQRTEVYRAIVRAGANGLTWSEIVQQLGCSPTANGRCSELRDVGLIVDSGQRRRTHTGRRAVVWIASPIRHGGRNID